MEALERTRRCFSEASRRFSEACKGFTWSQKVVFFTLVLRGSGQAVGLCGWGCSLTPIQGVAPSEIHPLPPGYATAYLSRVHIGGGGRMQKEFRTNMNRPGGIFPAGTSTAPKHRPSLPGHTVSMSPAATAPN